MILYIYMILHIEVLQGIAWYCAQGIAAGAASIPVCRLPDRTDRSPPRNNCSLPCSAVICNVLKCSALRIVGDSTRNALKCCARHCKCKPLHSIPPLFWNALCCAKLPSFDSTVLCWYCKKTTVLDSTKLHSTEIHRVAFVLCRVAELC